MPSNVRRYERSCKTLHKHGDLFFQCKTCDQTLQLYFCHICYINGEHTTHDIRRIRNRYDIYFCNCGDVTGLICCSVHWRRKISGADKPLHVNESGLGLFISTYNCETKLLSKLSRVNQIRKVDSRGNDYALIKRYFDNSNAHSRDIRLGQVWSFYRKDRELAFVESRFDQQLRILLWHGTRKENLVNILKKGLQRPYVEKGRDTANGSMFGKGIYFADRVSKSSQYSDSSGSGLLFLCEVALGRMYNVGTSETFESVPPRHDSIKGVGLKVPDPNGQLTFDQDIIVPCGITIRNPFPSVPNPSLQYNEYIVFNPRRILIKFIVEFKNIDTSLYGLYSNTQTSQSVILPTNRSVNNPLPPLSRPLHQPTNRSISQTPVPTSRVPPINNTLRPLSVSSLASSQTARPLIQPTNRSISQTVPTSRVPPINNTLRPLSVSSGQSSRQSLRANSQTPSTQLNYQSIQTSRPLNQQMYPTFRQTHGLESRKARRSKYNCCTLL